MWDMTSYSLKLTLYGHIHDVLTVTELSDGNIVSGSQDTTVMIWNSIDGTAMKRFTVNFLAVYCVYGLQDNTFAVSTAYDINIYIFQAYPINSKKLIQTLVGHKNTIYEFIYVNNRKNLASGGTDNDVIVWDDSLHYLKGHTDSIHALEVMPDNRLISGTDNGELIVWKEIKNAYQIPTYKFKSSIFAIKALTNNKIAIATSTGIVFFDIDQNREIYTITSNYGSVWGLALTNTGFLIASYSGTGLISIIDYKIYIS